VPTSKRGWYEWCKETSFEYILKQPLQKLDSQHFWDQMHALPEDQIERIEEEVVKRMVDLYKPNFQTLFFDTTNFFTFIDSTNERCTIAKRGKNKQKRGDLRQIGLALVVLKQEQYPLFHKTYEGNKNNVTVFKETLGDITHRLSTIAVELADITLVFDKGNNSKENFALLDAEESLHYVGSLVPLHFKALIQEANQNMSPITINDKEVLAYKTTKDIWGKARTCVVFISEILKDGQIRGILQHLRKNIKSSMSFRKYSKGKRN